MAQCHKIGLYSASVAFLGRNVINCINRRPNAQLRVFGKRCLRDSFIYLIEEALTVEMLAAMMHGYGQWNDGKLMTS